VNRNLFDIRIREAAVTMFFDERADSRQHIAEFAVPLALCLAPLSENFLCGFRCLARLPTCEAECGGQLACKCKQGKACCNTLLLSVACGLGEGRACLEFFIQLRQAGDVLRQTVNEDAACDAVVT